MGRWAASLYGMMSRGFPNMFIMPAPTQQSVVTVNYTQLALLGAEFVGKTVALLAERGVEVFDVSAQAEDAWIDEIVRAYIDRGARSCPPAHRRASTTRATPN